MPTNRERAERLLNDLDPISHEASVAALADAGLLAPDPAPRYVERPPNLPYEKFPYVVAGVAIVLRFTQHASAAERAAVLAALNALDEADRG